MSQYPKKRPADLPVGTLAMIISEDIGPRSYVTLVARERAKAVPYARIYEDYEVIRRLKWVFDQLRQHDFRSAQREMLAETWELSLHEPTDREIKYLTKIWHEKFKKLLILEP